MFLAAPTGITCHVTLRPLDTINLVLQDSCMATATKSLIEAHLKGRSLDALVATHRRQGNSWQAIADDVHDRTGVIISRETLRIWYPQHQTGINPAVRPRTGTAA